MLVPSLLLQWLSSRTTGFRSIGVSMSRDISFSASPAMLRDVGEVMAQVAPMVPFEKWSEEWGLVRCSLLDAAGYVAVHGSHEDQTILMRLHTLLLQMHWGVRPEYLPKHPVLEDYCLVPARYGLSKEGWSRAVVCRQWILPQL